MAAIPGFAGVYYDSVGDLVVSLKDSTQRRAAEGRFAAFVGRSHRPASLIPAGHRAALRFAAARYDYGELLTLREQVKRTLGSTDFVTSVGVDDARNAIRVGIRPGSLAQAEAIIGASGTLRAAVILEEREAASGLGDTLHLQSIPDRVIGAWQWNGSFGCTIGLPVLYGSSSLPGFLSAGHCVTESAPNAFVTCPSCNENWIGTAVEDADFSPIPAFTCGYSKPCVRADVVLVGLNSGVAYWLGGVANNVYLTRAGLQPDYGDPLAWNPELDSAGTNPPLQVDSEMTSTPWVGTFVGKFGRTTGASTGNITNSDSDILETSPVNVFVLHSVTVNMKSWHGDSGAPITAGDGNIVGGDYGVVFYGILWGGHTPGAIGSDSAFTATLYSPLSQIRGALFNSIRTH